ncbi:MAG: efflux RND transporter permease subunit, partial [Dehalococcoidia bacterium]|nr:efflux RND transporter permease subunit [Dehalococcoidia bacterium]
MKLTEISIKRPLFILMVVVGLLLMGIISYSRLGAEQYPAVNIPFVSVVTIYPGADPDEVERKVSKYLEDALAGTSGLKNLGSTSMENLSIVTLEFQEGVNGDAAAIDVERKVAAARSSLPLDAKPPSVIKAEYGTLPIMELALVGSRSSEQLFRLASEQVKPRLETVKGVASVQVVGGREREIKVRVDQDRLRAYGLSMQQVQGSLGQGNLSLPAGTVEEGTVRYRVRYDALSQSVEELADLVLQSTPRGVIRLRDVAQVEDGLKDQSFISRFNGIDSVGLLVTKQANANTMQVASDLRIAVASVEQTLPPKVQLDIAGDSSLFVRRDLDDIQTTLMLGVVLTGVVLLLFLHTIRSTIIVLLSIPTSLISTFIVMSLMGFTLNMMSMLALALTIGILVDDSIVVLENIFRHLKLGETAWTAAIKGRSEIGLAAIAITLVDVVVFVPVAFMSGVVGQFFRQFGLTIAAATLFSLFISFTLTPMLASRWLRSVEDGRSLWARFSRSWEAGYEALARGYGSLLGWGLRHRFTVLFISILAVAGALSMVPLNLVKTEFLPVEDQSRFKLIVEMLPGSTLTATDTAVRQLEERLHLVPEIQDYFTTVGMSGSGFLSSGEARAARISVNLVPKAERAKSASQLGRETERLGEVIPGMKLRAMLPTTGGDMGQPFLARLRGADQATLNGIADRVTAILREIPGTVNVTSSSYGGSPEVRVRGDQARLADLGLNSAVAATTLRSNFEGVVVGQLQPSGEQRVDIRLLGQEKGAWSPDKVSDL